MDEGLRVGFIIAWINRMAEKWGGVVYSTMGAGEAVRRYDWGQALCHEQYGPEWSDSSDLAASPTTSDVERAEAWEAGDWPDWAWTSERPHDPQETDDG